MSKVVDLHVPLSKPEVKEFDGELHVNVPGVIKIARDGDTPRCRALVRFYSAEWRALEGRPLTVSQRETEAFKAAYQRMVRKFGVPPIDWSSRPQVPGDGGGQ